MQKSAYEKLLETYMAKHTKEEGAEEVWGTQISSVSNTTTIGFYIKQKVLTLSKFLGLK